MEIHTIEQALKSARAIDENVLRVSAALRSAAPQASLINYAIRAPEVLWAGNRDTLAHQLAIDVGEDTEFWASFLEVLRREEGQPGINTGEAPSAPLIKPGAEQKAPEIKEAAQERSPTAHAPEHPAPTAPKTPTPESAKTAVTPEVERENVKPGRNFASEIGSRITELYKKGWTPLTLHEAVQHTGLEVKQLAKLQKGRMLPHLANSQEKLLERLIAIGDPPLDDNDPQNEQSPFHEAIKEAGQMLHQSRTLAGKHDIDLNQVIARVARDNSNLRPANTSLNNMAMRALEQGQSAANGRWSYPPKQIENLKELLKIAHAELEQEIKSQEQTRDPSVEERQNKLIEHFGLDQNFTVQEVMDMFNLPRPKALELIQGIPMKKAFIGNNTWKIIG